MSVDQDKILHTIAQTIFDKKGMNILALDVRGVSSLTDYVIIAEGNVDRHVIGIAHGVMDALRKEGERPFQVEGLETGDWVVLDYLEYMIHLFMPGVREKYRLEELFREGKIIDLKINIDSPTTI